MHAYYVVAFLLLLTATALAAYQRAWPLALVAAGLAVWLAPAVFELAP